MRAARKRHPGACTPSPAARTRGTFLQPFVKQIAAPLGSPALSPAARRRPPATPTWFKVGQSPSPAILATESKGRLCGNASWAGPEFRWTVDWENLMKEESHVHRKQTRFWGR